jgi:hypothetical protein
MEAMNNGGGPVAADDDAALRPLFRVFMENKQYVCAFGATHVFDAVAIALSAKGLRSTKVVAVTVEER